MILYIVIIIKVTFGFVTSINRTFYTDSVEYQCLSQFSGFFFFFEEFDTLVQKFIWNFKETKIAKSISKKKKVGELTFLDFKIY